MDDAALREEIIAAALRTIAVGLNRGTSGNVSARIAGGFLVTRYSPAKPPHATGPAHASALPPGPPPNVNPTVPHA